MDDYKLKIHNSFSSKAESYDAHAKIQKVVAERMIERLDVMNFTPKNILDLGCGTGLLTSLLNKRYNDSRIISVDFSSEMLKTCFEKDVKSSFVCADIEYLPFKSMNFDLVISNFTLHWCQNLQKILLDVQNNLTDQGIFFFSTLGPDSLNELREAFLEVDRFNHVNNFIDMHHYGDMLNDVNFVDPVMDVENITLKFNSFFDKPPNESIKRLSDLLSPPFISCFSFHKKNFSAEIIYIKSIRLNVLVQVYPCLSQRRNLIFLHHLLK